MNRYLVSLILFMVLMVPLTSAQENTTALETNPGMVGPGSMFYGLEIAIDKASMNAGIKSAQDVAAERASEALVATEQNNTQGAQQALDNLNEISKQNDISENGTSKTMQILKQVQEKTPQQAQKGIQTAIKNANKGNTQAQKGPENKPETPNMPENNNTENRPEINRTQNPMEENNTQTVNQTQEPASDNTTETKENTQINQTQNKEPQTNNQTRP